MSGHAFIAPSSMGITVHCSYYPHIAAMFPDDDDTDSRDGTAAHWVMEEVLNSYKGGYVEGRIRVASDFLGKTAPNSVIIDDEMVDAAKVMISHCLKLVDTHGAGQMMCVEQRLQMPQYSGR